MHVDMDAFFVSVELRSRPELRGRQVIVGFPAERSVVLSASYEARALGVKSAMPMAVAQRMCPQAAIIEPRHKLYYEVSGQGLRAARDAVAALAAHPQPFRSPAQEPSEPEDDDEPPQRFPYRYRAIASKGDVTREVSSNMLNDEIYGRIRTLAKSGNIEAAATALTRHSDITMKQAREFIALLDD